MKTNELVKINGKMCIIEREMTEEEIATWQAQNQELSEA